LPPFFGSSFFGGGALPFALGSLAAAGSSISSPLRILIEFL